jgi:hypothetical protein
MKNVLKCGGSLLVLLSIAGTLAATPAAAQDAASLKALQAQILQLQQQLQKLQADAAKRDMDMMKKPDAMPAMPASALSVPSTVPPGSAIMTMPPNDKDAAGKPIFNTNKPNGKFNLGGVTIQLGGIVDLTGLYRTRNTNGNTPTPFTQIPFPDSPNYHTGEIRAEAQNTRFTALAQGAPYDGGLLSGYVEMDFGSAGSSTSATQTNSYTLRIRQAYLTLDDAASGVHFLGGQAWSLATPFKAGLIPRTEASPYVVENGYIAGWFGNVRQPQVRVTDDLNDYATIGASVESPASTFGGTKPTLPTGQQLLTGSTPSTGTIAINTGTAATTGNNPLVSYSYNTIPDLVIKGALDPSFGHFEAFALARFFTTQKDTALTSGDLNAAGGGVGVNGIVKAIPGLIDIQANVAAGYGIGRYGASGLVDATYKADGTPKPLPEVMGAVGITGHVTPKLDLYTWVGIEQESRSFSGSGATASGYGNPSFSNAGCDVQPENALANTCSANTNIRGIEGFQVGGWYNIYRGGFGTMQTGAEYEFVERTSFKGVGGSPSTNDNIVLFAVRYFPFQ